MSVKIKKFREDAVIPCKATDGSAAMDVKLPETVQLKHGRQVIKLGWGVEMPEDLCMIMQGRSGYESKGFEACDDAGNEIRVNADVLLGLIDSDYRGEVGVIVNCNDFACCNNRRKVYLTEGQRIAQIRFVAVPQVKVEEVDELNETERGTGGFGSTNG